MVYPVHQTMPAVERAWRSFMLFKQLLPGHLVERTRLLLESFDLQPLPHIL
jgi:hypothetical protein